MDFFSGIVLRALGIPVSMFTVLFAVARSVGWITQWKEMSEEKTKRISRPRQARRRTSCPITLLRGTYKLITRRGDLWLNSSLSILCRLGDRVDKR